MPEVFTLTVEKLDAFERRGVVRLSAFYSQAVIDRMRDRLWSDLEERYGISRGAPLSWTIAHPAGFQRVKRSGAFEALGSPELFRIADVLLGPGCWDKPQTWGNPLVTFPTPAPALARPPWHLDLSGSERLGRLPILRVFTFLEPALPGGGGTLYVAGSHHLAIEAERGAGRPLRSAEMCGRLKARHPWFAELFTTATEDLDRLIGAEATIASYPIRLEEMTGTPGDLIIMHPAIVHAAAHNALDRPRMMLTEWIPRRE